jgi:two-component system chemotaxis response regulator CheB
VSRIVVIGGSAGALATLRTMLPMLKPDFPAPICVVLHIGRYPNDIARLLDQTTGLPVAFATHGGALLPGHVHVAPPDHHLLVTREHTLLSKGPRENFARPSIDPLFRSAAAAFGAGAIGVVLSGRLNDGTPGLYAIKEAGGIAIVEDPATAEFPEMPRSARENVPTDHFVPREVLAPLLDQLVRQEDRQPMQEEAAAMSEALIHDDPVALTCPECGGAMRSAQVGRITQFVCHIGHRMTLETLVDAQLSKVDEAVQIVLRRLNELVKSCREMIEAAGTNEQERRRWEEVEAKVREQLAALDGLSNSG